MYTASDVIRVFIGICIFVGVSCPFIYSVIRCLTFNRVYLSSMLFCACSSVTIAICIINAYMLVLCLYMCNYIVCAAVPCLSCAGDQAVTVRKLSVVLVLVRFAHSVYRRRDYIFWPVIGFTVWPV